MKRIIAFFVASLVLSTGSLGHSEEYSIIDVRRNITLADNDPVYKDFYINAGDGTGLKKNLVVTAVRKLTIRDASGAQAYGEIFVPVGQLKIIAVFNRIAVAREFTLLSRDELPMLEQIGIMTGDRIDLQGSFIDTSKPRRKVSEVPSPLLTPEATVVSVTLAPSAPQPPVAASTSVEHNAAPAHEASKAPASTTAPIIVPTTVTPASTPAQKLEKTADSGNTTEL